MPSSGQGLCNTALASDRWRWAAKWPRNKRLHYNTYCFRVVLALRVLSSYEFHFVLSCFVDIVRLLVFVSSLIVFFSSLLHCLHCLHCFIVFFFSFSLYFPFLDTGIRVWTTYCLTFILRHWHCLPIHSEQVCPYRSGERLKIYLLFFSCVVFHPCISCPLHSLISNSQAGPDLISLFFFRFWYPQLGLWARCNSFFFLLSSFRWALMLFPCPSLLKIISKAGPSR